jgi:hypothetical protein
VRDLTLTPVACVIASAAGLEAQEPAGTITGSVRDSVSKAAVPDVEVSFDGPGFPSKVKTDGKGVFRRSATAPSLM